MRGRDSATWRAKKGLATLIVIGLVSCLSVGGTYAIFSSQSANQRASIISGTLTMGNTVGAGTACSSFGAGTLLNVNKYCDQILTVGTQQYPGVANLVHVTIADTGTIDAADLALYMPSCTHPGRTTGAPTSPPAPGGGDPCAAGSAGPPATSGTEFYVQETDSSFAPTYCWYPDNAAGTCSWTPDTLNDFSTNDNTLGFADDLGSGPTVSTPRYFIIGIRLPPDASNTLQGEEALFKLTWHMTA